MRERERRDDDRDKKVKHATLKSNRLQAGKREVFFLLQVPTLRQQYPTAGFSWSKQLGESGGPFHRR